MKKIINLILGTILLLSFSCEDPLDKQPLNLITEEAVWNDPVLIDMFVADLYHRAEFFWGKIDDNNGMAEIANAGWCRTFGTWQLGYQHTNVALTAESSDAIAAFHFWEYGSIREINTLIEKLSDESIDIDPDFRMTRLGEGYFLRAWFYFKMARLYGGVPIIDRVQQLGEPEEDLLVPRSSEEETYDFIASDLDRARTLLTGRNLSESGRATEWSALALKSRAMMFAASAGEFGTMQTIGSGALQTTLGIPDPDKFWQLSRDASKEIIDNGPFQLYQQESDLVANFTGIFEDEGNSEIIFSEVLDGANSRRSRWDRWMQPSVTRVGYSNMAPVLLPALEAFEYLDGSPGTLDPAKHIKGDPSNLHSLDDIWYNRDPRARATIYWAETPWRGNIVYKHQATYKLDENGVRQLITSGNVSDGTRMVPASGLPRDRDISSLHVKKRLKESFDLLNAANGGDASDVDFIVFRLAEIYLNYAEAELYVSNPYGDGLTYLNRLRERAGMPLKTSLTEEVLRKERDVELMFEGQRYYDVRRWRIAESLFNGVKIPGVLMNYDFDADKYEIWIANQGGAQGDVTNRVFESHYYYYPISLSRINSNPALVQNPGY